jgi:hypothetical protein
MASPAAAYVPARELSLSEEEMYGYLNELRDVCDAYVREHPETPGRGVLPEWPGVQGYAILRDKEGSGVVLHLLVRYPAISVSRAHGTAPWLETVALLLIAEHSRAQAVLLPLGFSDSNQKSNTEYLKAMETSEKAIHAFLRAHRAIVDGQGSGFFHRITVDRAICAAISWSGMPHARGPFSLQTQHDAPEDALAVLSACVDESPYPITVLHGESRYFVENHAPVPRPNPLPKLRGEDIPGFVALRDAAKHQHREARRNAVELLRSALRANRMDLDLATGLITYDGQICAHVRDPSPASIVVDLLEGAPSAARIVLQTVTYEMYYPAEVMEPACAAE